MVAEPSSCSWHPHNWHARFARRANVPHAVGIAGTPKSVASFHPSCVHKEGRFAIVTNVGRGMRWTQSIEARSSRGRAMFLRTAKSCGPGAPTLALSFATLIAKRRWQESPVTGETTYKP